MPLSTWTIRHGLHVEIAMQTAYVRKANVILLYQEQRLKSAYCGTIFHTVLLLRLFCK